MVIGGNLDGLMRVTRLAETYYHANKNIRSEQEGLFQVELVQGMNHQSFVSDLDASSMPAYIRDHDLEAERTREDAQMEIQRIVSS